MVPGPLTEAMEDAEAAIQVVDTIEEHQEEQRVFEEESQQAGKLLDLQAYYCIAFYTEYDRRSLERRKRRLRCCILHTILKVPITVAVTSIAVKEVKKALPKYVMPLSVAISLGGIVYCFYLIGNMSQQWVSVNGHTNNEDDPLLQGSINEEAAGERNSNYVPVQAAAAGLLQLLNASLPDYEINGGNVQGAEGCSSSDALQFGSGNVFMPGGNFKVQHNMNQIRNNGLILSSDEFTSTSSFVSLVENDQLSSIVLTGDSAEVRVLLPVSPQLLPIKENIINKSFKNSDRTDLSYFTASNETSSENRDVRGNEERNSPPQRLVPTGNATEVQQVREMAPEDYNVSPEVLVKIGCFAAVLAVECIVLLVLSYQGSLSDTTLSVTILMFTIMTIVSMVTFICACQVEDRNHPRRTAGT